MLLFQEALFNLLSSRYRVSKIYWNLAFRKLKQFYVLVVVFVADAAALVLQLIYLINKCDVHNCNESSSEKKEQLTQIIQLG